jgi:hypothetical protein
VPATFVAGAHHNWSDLRELPLIECKARFKKLIIAANKNIRRPAMTISHAFGFTWGLYLNSAADAFALMCYHCAHFEVGFGLSE